MYIAVLAIPVPEANLAAYREWAAMSAVIFKRYGCLEVIDGWDDYVPKGVLTDFYRAVAAEEDEKVVISIQLWPGKDEFFAAESKMHEEGALDFEGEIPFDPSRLITGCFTSLDNTGGSGDELG